MGFSTRERSLLFWNMRQHWMFARRISGNCPWREDEDVMSLFLPYSGDRADPALAAKHEALGSLPKGTLGRGYWEIYKSNGYAFPGDPKGVNAAFARPHDSTHVIGGYDTTPHGEILVS